MMIERDREIRGAICVKPLKAAKLTDIVLKCFLVLVVVSMLFSVKKTSVSLIFPARKHLSR